LVRKKISLWKNRKTIQVFYFDKFFGKKNNINDKFMPGKKLINVFLMGSLLYNITTLINGIFISFQLGGEIGRYQNNNADDS